ncbi:hypothetical protein TNCV_2556921 [Trichonephila clavipes]|nr:hypothetical protein TNCV_2556921 [Trichonephila clavipes]
MRLHIHQLKKRISCHSCRWAYGSQSDPPSHVIVVNGPLWSSSPRWRRGNLIGRWYVERGRSYEALGNEIKVGKKVHPGMAERLACDWTREMSELALDCLP